MTWAKVGMKIACVDDSWAPLMGNPLHAGHIYTVEGFTPADVVGEIGVILVEAKSDYPWGHSYRLTRFQPLVTKTQSEDVAMFKRIADQVPNMEMQE